MSVVNKIDLAVINTLHNENIKFIQLEFELLADVLYIPDLCMECLNKCKIECIQKDVHIYCKNYKSRR